MSLLSRSVMLLSSAVLICTAVPAFAESAPVFDADSMAQQFEAEADPSQDAPPPSVASVSQDNGFVPVSRASAKATVAAAPKSSGSLEQRLRKVEQQLTDSGASESLAKVDSLQDQMQTLRGQVEQLTHQLQQMQAQQKTMYTDLDKRLTQNPLPATKTPAATKKVTPPPADVVASNHPTPAPVPTPKKTSLENEPNVAEEQQIYQTALNLIKAKKYNEAVEAFQDILKKYPSGQFASNAHYWLGELYGLLGKNDLALAEFSTVVKTYPESPRVSDAQLKVGLIYTMQSKWPDAKTTFKNVVNRYPGTASARLASEQLKQIKVAGH